MATQLWRFLCGLLMWPCRLSLNDVLCARGNSSNWATPPCSVKPWFYWPWEAHSRTMPWPQHRWIDRDPKTEGEVVSRASHWSSLLIRYILSKVSVLAVFLSASVMSICLTPCYKEQRLAGEGTMKWASSIITVSILLLGTQQHAKEKKQELDVILLKSSILCAPLSEATST